MEIDFRFIIVEHQYVQLFENFNENFNFCFGIKRNSVEFKKKQKSVFQHSVLSTFQHI